MSPQCHPAPFCRWLPHSPPCLAWKPCLCLLLLVPLLCRVLLCLVRPFHDPRPCARTTSCFLLSSQASLFALPHCILPTTNPCPCKTSPCRCRCSLLHEVSLLVWGALPKHIQRISDALCHYLSPHSPCQKKPTHCNPQRALPASVAAMATLQ